MVLRMPNPVAVLKINFSPGDAKERQVRFRTDLPMPPAMRRMPNRQVRLKIGFGRGGGMLSQARQSFSHFYIVRCQHQSLFKVFRSHGLVFQEQIEISGVFVTLR